MFQMTFAIITCALILGSVADRIHFAPMLVFISLWFVAVYCPVAHWVWGPGGLLGGTGVSDFAGIFGLGPVLDYAGGTVVHINSGIAGLVAAIVLGKKTGFGTQRFTPHNLVYSVIGASMLWVGWFGFNAGSALSAGDRAGMAMLVTQFASAAAAMSWMLIEWGTKGKPSVLGTISGAVAGLVAITPASGFVGPAGALIIGVASGLLCFWATTSLKNKLGYDDTLDVFGIHCVGGLVGAILTGVFATSSIGGVAGALEGNSTLVLAQTAGALVTFAYSGVMTFVILKLVSFVMPLRVDEEVEKSGLDLALHGERVH
jgi:Amt family ammonium transporter